MIALDKLVASVAWPLAFGLSALVLLLTAAVFMRRAYRALYFRSLDRTREACGPIIEDVAAGSIAVGEGLRRLGHFSRGKLIACLEAVLEVEENHPERI